MELDPCLKRVYIDIHRAIHDKPYVSTVMAPEGPLGIKCAVGGMRNVNYDGFLFMAQNPAKESTYALAARRGSKITWGINKDKWLLITDHIAKEFLTSTVPEVV